ncbi:MAG: hypothetical protein KBC19_01430 [Candidatus Moranbacteria bacterium]|nr:hypothetical protein [Candidatus Moranbacteria bacterium]
MTKTLILTLLFIGSAIGGYIPLLWGGSAFSLSSVFWSTLGGFVGIYFGFILGRKIDSHLLLFQNMTPCYECFK